MLISPKRQSLVPMIVILACALLYWGLYVRTAAQCWHRGGTVLKNAFDWPTCVNVGRP